MLCLRAGRTWRSSRRIGRFDRARSSPTADRAGIRWCPEPSHAAASSPPAKFGSFGDGDWARIVGVIGTVSDNPLAAASRTIDWSYYRDTFPISITHKTLERGQERFNIYCAVCHDRVGAGKGMIVERGYTAPPSFHTDPSRGFKLKGIDLKLRDAPVGYYFEVITHGFGAMPDYAEQITADDRWAIIAYIRALQFSQRASLTDIRDDSERARLSSRKRAKGAKRMSTAFAASCDFASNT